MYEAQNLEVRNATCLAIAPTGTISIIAGTSASIEPLFALAYRRTQVLDEQTLAEINPCFRTYLERLGLPVEQLTAEVLKIGRFQGIAGLPEAGKHLFVTALEIPVEHHLRVQAAF